MITTIQAIVLLLGVSSCFSQIVLPKVTKRTGVLNGPTILGSGQVRNFVTYPNVRRGSYNGGYNGQYDQIFAQPQQVIAPADLERVATYGLTNGVTGGIALGANSHVLGPVLAAIITHRTAEVVDVPTPTDVIVPQVLIVEPNLLPVTIEFRSQSSPVNINQVHIPGPPGEVKETRSEEEPDRVLHEVVKPVIQEVREIIQPFRRITQEILPVQEEVHSLVARGENQKVLKEVAIPAPAPVLLHSAPVAQAVAVQQPVIHALGESLPSLSRTVVRAGLIGGARVLEAPDHIVAESITKRSGRKIRGDGETQSINNRGSVRPAK